MKIPGYKHLIEDVLPDINLYLDTINMKVFRKTGEKFKSNVTEFRGVNEKNIFVFKTSEGNIIEWDFNTIYTKDQSLLRTIISWYLWAKYTSDNKQFIFTDEYLGNNVLFPGVYTSGAMWSGKLKSDEEFSTIMTYSIKGGIILQTGMHVVNPLEIASWKILTKKKTSKKE